MESINLLRVYCLYRVSTKGQVDKDDIPMQKKACRAFAEKMGWTICKEYMEKGVSGYKVSANDRDAIQDLKVAAEKKEFDILLVFMFDRLGRIPNETPFVLEWFVKSGIQVWSTKEGQQTFETDCDYLLNYIRFWQAGGESRKTSMRVKTRLGQLVEEGRFTGGAAVFGYRFVKSGIITKKGRELVALEIVPEEAAIVQYIFKKTVEEGYGTWRICNLLNAQGYKTHSGAKFQANTINRMLRNHIYTGHYVRGGKKSTLLENLKIIDESLFEEAQKILEARNAINAKKSSLAYTTRGAALLGGNIFCAHCGCKMHAVSYQDPVILADGTRKVYRGITYICPNRARKRGECAGQSQYKSTKIDEAVMNLMHQIFKQIQATEKDDTLKIKYEEAVKERKEEYNRLLREYEREQQILQKLVESVGEVIIGASSSFTIETLNAAINTAKEKIARFERLIPEALKSINNEKENLQSLDSYYDNFKGWAGEFDCASHERKKMIICNLVKSISIGKEYKLDIVLNMDYQQFLD